MGYLFIDIETYIDKRKPKSGLNPYTSNSKVISIAYNYYDQFRLSDEHIKNPTILNEWESNEKDILGKFYRFLKMKVEDDEHIKLVGFNHIKFDLSYLFGRFIINEIAEPFELYDLLYSKPHCIDLGQLSQVLSKKMKEKQEIYNVSQKEANRFFKLPVRQGSGIEYTKYYDNKEFDKYQQAVLEEFSFEKLYLNLKDHFKKKNTMERSSKRIVQKGLFDQPS